MKQIIKIDHFTQTNKLIFQDQDEEQKPVITISMCPAYFDGVMH